MQNIDIKDLLKKFKEGSISEEELALLENWYLQWEPEASNLSLDDVVSAKAEIWKSLPLNTENQKTVRTLWPRIVAAASILLFLSVGGYFLLRKQPQLVAKTHDIAPGSNKAILTLANGNTIDLSNAKNGKLANQGNVIIKKKADGQIVYTGSQNDLAAKSLGFNTATTPRGGQYQLILPDGTKVWLNAASSIKYPVVFNNNERVVELTGEAYFEVVYNKKKPFRVVSNGQVVEDLGTHFNIKAYSDEEEVKTTLLEGSVKVSSGERNKILKPGEQSQLEDGNIQVADVDVNEVVAWKNGYFQFKDDNIKDVMRQLARWYDVDIKYEGSLPNRTFSGAIPRNVNISQVQDILSFEKIHFKVDGKTIIVMP